MIEPGAPSAARSPLQPTPRPRAWALPLCLILVAVAYLPGLRGGFVYDDLAMVVRNPRITSFSHLPEMLTQPMLDFLDPQTAAQVGYWRPVAGLALTLGYTLTGGEALGFHLVSLALHLAAVAIAFRLGWRLSKNRAFAFAGALLFGLHPTHVEGVSWVSAINDPLFGLFSLLALDSFAAWRERGSQGTAWRSALWLLPALLSKEMAAAIAPMALALDLARGRARDGQCSLTDLPRPFWRAYGPMAIAVAVYYSARVAVFGDVLAGFDRVTTDFGVPALRLLQARIELLGGFLGLLAWPADLNLFRAFRPEVPLSDPGFLLALAWIAALVLASRSLWKRRDGLALAAVLLVPAAISPALLRMQSLGIFLLSDRFLYLATLGAGWLIAWATLRWLPRVAAITALTLIAGAYGARVVTRTAFWHDEESLFSTAVEQSPKSPYVRWGYARVLLQSYRETRRLEDLRRAQEQAQQALDLLSAAQQGDGSIFATREDHVQSNLCLGWCLLYEAEIDPYHDFSTALHVFTAVAERYPDSPYGHTGVGVASMQIGRLDEAEAAFRRSIQLNPKYPEAHHNLGILLLRRGDPRAAAAEFERALANRPDVLEDLLLLARAQLESEARSAALATIARARARFPDSPGPLVYEGMIAAEDGNVDEANRRVDEALDKDPDHGEALFLKSKLLLARGETAGALNALLRAAEVMPTNFDAHYNAGVLLLQRQGLEASMEHLFRAYVLRPENELGRLFRDKLLELPIDDPDRSSHFAAIDVDRGDTSTALRWLDKALSSKPDHGPSLFLKGVLVEKAGDAEAAEDLLRRACDAMPGSFDAHQEFGTLLANLDRPAEALPFLEKALKIAERAAGSNPEAAVSLDRLREALDHAREAAR